MSTSKDFFDYLILRIKDYISLKDNEVEFIQSLFKEEHYINNEVLLREGNVCKKLYFVADGIVRFSQLADGEERTYVIRSEGAFCNDLESFLNQIPSKNSISAVGNTVVLSITYGNLQIFYNEVTHGDRFGRLAMEQKYTTVVNQLSTLYFESPEQRYLRYISNHKDLLQRLPQYYIASQMGVSPQALCRIKKKLLSCTS